MKKFSLLLLFSVFLFEGCLPKKDGVAGHSSNQGTSRTNPASEPAAPGPATPQPAAPQPATVKPGSIPIDPHVTIKQLDNGLTYYIRKNGKPENRMELRLVINAGSVLEDEDQQGLAHFLEHMAFNGTRHFEKQELVDYIQSIGMRFGADLNAYTSFDETVYMLKVPTDDEEIMTKAFLILEDWSHGITLENEEVEKERGVVVEEWRRGRGAQARLRDKQFSVLFHRSRYADRLPIGQKTIIENATAEPLRRFYRDWYRPDLMAVVAVGDFDSQQIESLIVKHFQHLKNPENPRERDTYPVPDHEETLFSIETDPELTQSIVQIYYKHPATRVENMATYREAVIADLNEGMLNQRLRERTTEANPPFIAGFSAMTNMVRTKDFFVQAAMVKENGYAEGLTALLSEGVRARRYGFQESELERQKKGILRGLENAYNEREKSHSAMYAGQYASHYLNGTPIPGIENRLKLYNDLMPGIKLEEVNGAAKERITLQNRVITFSAPEKKDLAVPTSAELLAVIDRVNQLEIEEYQDNVSDAPLVARMPPRGKLVEKNYRENLEIWEWRLSNGVRVILKPTDFQNDEIRMTAFSAGGTSLVSDADYVAGATATSLIDESGLGPFDAIELEKKLAGKVVGVSPYLAETSEGFSGSAAPKDAETLFQLIYLYFTQPRVDGKAFESIKTRWQAFIQNRDASPDRVFSDEITRRLYGDHPRRRPFTQETLEQMNAETSLKIYKDRFANAGDFTFLLVGNLDIETLQPLVETYLGGLPATGRQESWRDVGAAFSKGVQKFEVFKGLEPKSTVQLIFTGDAVWNSENRYALNSLSQALRIRLREVLREDMGGVYGVSVFGSISKRPAERYRVNIRFSCDPANVDNLVSAIFEEIRTIQKQGIDESYLTKIKEIQTRQYETNLKRNSFWLSNLDFCYEYGIDPANILEYPNRVKRLSSDTIRGAAKAYFDEGNYLFGVLYPEAQASN